MQNKIWGAITILLIISLVALYLVFSESRTAEKSLDEVAQKLDLEIQRINKNIHPNIPTGNPVGFIIKFENGAKFYIAGDTGAMADMKYVIHDYYRPDVAILPIGGMFTMGPELAAFAASLIEPTSYVISSHYDTYPVLEQDSADFLQELRKYNVKAGALSFEPGETKEIMGVKITWLGHNGWFFVSSEGTRIVVDPSIQYNPSYPETYKDVSVFERVDIILLTHGHPDHTVIVDLKRFVEAYKPIIFAPYELQSWLEKFLETPLTFGLNIGAEISKALLSKSGTPEENLQYIDDRLRVYVTSAAHSSSAIPF